MQAKSISTDETEHPKENLKGIAGQCPETVKENLSDKPQNQTKKKQVLKGYDGADNDDDVRN